MEAWFAKPTDVPMNVGIGYFRLAELAQLEGKGVTMYCMKQFRSSFFRERATTLLALFVVTVFFVPSAHADESHSFPPVSTSGDAAAQQQSSTSACALLTVADAAFILKAPARKFMDLDGCVYHQGAQGTADWSSSVVLNVTMHATEKEESEDWEDRKILRQLHAGRKNLTVLSGIGDEAYLGTVSRGEAIQTMLDVHKNKSHFWLSSTTEHPVDIEALKTVAKKIAQQLP